MGNEYWEEASIILLGSWKSHISPILSAGYGFSYMKMLIFHLAAAAISTLIAIYISRRLLNKPLTRFRILKSERFSHYFRKVNIHWQKYGFWMMIFLAPVIFGIPISAFISSYFKTKMPYIFGGLFLAICFWATTFYIIGRTGQTLFTG